MTQYISAKELFTGRAWISEVVIEIMSGRVMAIKKEGYDHKNAFPLVVPALIDLQIYGAGGKLLSEFPEASTIQLIYNYCVAGGAAYFQPTIASQSNEIIMAAIKAVKDYKSAGGKGCMGLHIEGPWINPIKKGAHNEAVIHPPTMEEVRAIVDFSAEDIGMITVAPEICSKEIIDFIQSKGIVISAGHTNADYETAMSFFDKGIQVATHLYNAMSPLQHRAPGLVGALFNHPRAMCSLVADGYHVDFSAIQIAKKLMGDRLFCITDAVTTTNTGFYQHYLVGDKYESAGTLSGSALTQLKSVNNLVEQVGIELGEAVKMCSLYPATLMQQKGIRGTIEVNENADLICLSADRQLLKMYLA